MGNEQWTPVDEDVVKTTAAILGAHSAAARALLDAQRRRTAGETVEFFLVGSSIVVRGTEPA